LPGVRVKRGRKIETVNSLWKIARTRVFPGRKSFTPIL
jgi:hypothetical protein